MIAVTMLWAVASLLGSGPPVDSPGGPAARLTGVAAWEIPLSERPVAPPTPVAGPAGEERILLPLEHSLEMRRAEDGELVWARGELAGGGLALGPPVAMPNGLGLGWAGTIEGVGPQLVVLALTDGSTALETPLARTAAGPPTGVLDDLGQLRWFAPLRDGLVETLADDGRSLGSATVGPALQLPLIACLGRALAAVGSGREVITLGPASARPAARGVAPDALAVVGRWIYAGGRRSLAAWRCRVRPRGTVACRLEWRQHLGGEISAPPLVLGDRVVAASRDAHIYAFDRRSGHLIWRTFAGWRIAAPLLKWNDLVAALPEGVARIQFFRLTDGGPAGVVEGGPDEVFLAGAARAGDLLVVPTLPYPSLRPTLRAYQIGSAERPTGDASPPAPAPAQRR